MNILDVPLVVYLWGLIVLLPGLALCTRRLHDSGKSDWNLLWILAMPLSGIEAIALIFLQTRPRTPVPNQYGHGPATA